MSGAVTGRATGERVSLVCARGLTKVFGGPGGRTVAVDGIDLDLPAGASLGVVGESGSGKSTLARLVLRLIEPTAGELTFAGRDLCALRGRALREQRRSMQMVFQNPYASLVPGRTVAENIAEPLRVHRAGSASSRRVEAARLLDLVGLSRHYLDVYPRNLSGGQQQRVAIARALVLKPSLLVCDEPTSALDVSIQAQILVLLSSLQRELAFSMLFITHNLAVAQRLTDRIMVMRRGTVIESGPTAAIFADPQEPYTQLLLESCLPVRGAPAV